MEIKEHIVRFDIWCNKCKHKDTKEIDSPCNECLDDGSNFDTNQPVIYEPKQ